MKIRNGFIPVSSVGMLVLGLVLFGPAAAAGSLFYEADEFLSAAEEIGVIGAARYRAVFVEPRRLGEITIDGQLDPAAEVVLNLFEDTVVEASLERCYPAVGEGWVWEGSLLPPHSGTVVIAFSDRTLAAEVELDGKVFQVRHDGGPIHLVRELSAADVAFLKSAQNAQELDVFNRTNQERQSRGLHLFAWNDQLGNAARAHSQDMGVRNFFSHTGSDGSSVGERITRAGYSWNQCAENIAAGNSTASATMTQWMNSPGHRANILNTTSCDLGVGYVFVSGSTYGHYWTQNFARRSGVTSCPYVPPPSPTTVSAPYQLYAADFTGNGKVDIAVFRPSTGLWAIRGWGRAYHGRSGDIPVPADWTGNGRADIAIFRPSTGLWSVRNVTRFYLGRSGDIPMPFHYSGGSPRAAIFRPSTGLWATNDGQRFYLGRSGDIPVPGPYNSRSGRRGEVRAAIFRPSTGMWAISGRPRVYLGRSGDIPVPGAYSSGANDTWQPAIFRPSTGMWAILNGPRFFLGRSGDIPVPGDYSGGWGDQFAIFRPSTGMWAINGLGRVYHGRSGDIPAVR